ncbi:hypothetical protein [Bosea sp. BIWAKO-01]|uniref:hypothetical protein n=1 Tax=Bosea sp. BIWAKO-01 TaxID=506668 RepID=UPI000868990F|nr:hypothetical protein [Bosea sp. BIWAKO-01]GAU86191.1 hypothetical protein BIWAKO_06139 [Bosea sp. BIWAKO-01]
MGYTYAITPDKMFEDRLEQFVTLGIPAPDTIRTCDIDLKDNARNGDWLTPDCS